MRRFAFTLAEVLITLLIIGIVAALTIPSVISNAQQQEFKTGLKKAVSVLNESIQANIALEGETPYDSSKGIADYLSRHMSIIKSDFLSSGYLVDGVKMDDNSYVSVTRNFAFYTTDGMRFEINSGYPTLNKANIRLYESDYKLEYLSRYNKCGSYGMGSDPNNTKIPPCFILVDVNGDRKPTVYGANVTVTSTSGGVVKNYVYPSISDKKLTDIFPILITEEKAIPFGVVAQRAMYSK